MLPHHTHQDHPKDVSTLIEKVLKEYREKNISIRIQDNAAGPPKFRGAEIVQAAIDKCDLLNMKLDPEGFKLLCMSEYGDAILRPLLNELLNAYVQDFTHLSPETEAFKKGIEGFLLTNAYRSFIESDGNKSLDLYAVFEATSDLELKRELLLYISVKFSALDEICNEVDREHKQDLWRTSLRHALNNYRAIFTGIFSMSEKPNTQPEYNVKDQTYVFIEDDKFHCFGDILEGIEGLAPFKLDFKKDDPISKSSIPKNSQFLDTESFSQFLTKPEQPLPDTVICDINLGPLKKTGISLAEELHEKYGSKRPFKLLIYSKDVETPSIKALLDDLLRSGKIDGYTSKDYDVLPRNLAAIINETDTKRANNQILLGQSLPDMRPPPKH